MAENETSKANMSPARKYWLYFLPVLAVLIAYVGWVMLARWHENKQAEERAAEQARQKERADAKSAVESLGGNKFDIIAFYVSPGAIRRGESAQLCYGVSNTKTVSLDPPVEEVWPSASRCFDVSPKKTTTFTLTAEDAHGEKKTQSLELQVR
jgi:hypothetical protein